MISVSTGRQLIIAPSYARRKNLHSPITDHHSLMNAAEILKKIRTLEIKTRGLVETVFAGNYHSVFEGRGTDPALALDYLNKVVTRRAVVFFISDFQAPDFSRTLAVSGRRHDFIAIEIQDEREQVLPNVGMITLEDAETGEQIEINTADRGTRTVFADLVTGFETELSRTLRRNA